MRIRRFYGEIPRETPANLPGGYACHAVDVKLWRGRIEPFMQPRVVCELDDAPCVVARVEGDPCCWTGSCDPCATFTESVGCYEVIRSERGGHPEYLVGRDAECACLDRWCRLGLPVPDGNPTLTGPESCTEHGTMRRYVFTFSRRHCDAEGAPGAPTNAVVMDTCDVAAAIDNIPQPPPDWCVDEINVYRLESTWDAHKGFKQAEGGDLPHSPYFDVHTEAEWFHVVTVPVGTTTIVDDLSPDELGHTLTTYDYFPPPKGLRIVGETTAGSLVGYLGHTLWFSERGLPHAWPPKHMMRFDDEIKRVAVDGSTAFVATTSRPAVVSDQVDCDKPPCRSVALGAPAAICSERSMTVHDGAAWWATREGYVTMGADAVVRRATSQLFTPDDWRQLEPSTMQAVWHEGMLFFTTNVTAGYMDLEVSERPLGVVHLSSAPVQWYEDKGGVLYLLADGKVLEWDAGPELMPYHWKSAPDRLDGRKTVSAYKARLSEYCLDDKSGRKVSVMVSVDGRRVHSRSLNHSHPVRIRQARGIEWCFALTGTAVVDELHWASTVRGLLRNETGS